jgi:hypothetical protein
MVGRGYIPAEQNRQNIRNDLLSEESSWIPAFETVAEFKISNLHVILRKRSD